MEKVRVSAVNVLIRAIRKVFYNTPVMRWKLTEIVYDKVFILGGTDLSKPIAFRDSQFYVDGNDRSYLPTMLGGYYEKLELDVFEKVVTTSRTFLDIGANVGMYSVLASKRSPKLTCYAFEPVKENYDLIAKNIKLNSLDGRVTVVKKAVSDRIGKASIFLSETSSGMHSLTVQHKGVSRQISTITIDSFCLAKGLKPDLIKVDVEGHEPSAFAGMKQVLETYKPTIFMEFLAGVNGEMDELIKTFAKIYKYCYVVDEIKGTLEKVKLSDLKLNKNYNIILSKSNKHTAIIENQLS